MRAPKRGFWGRLLALALALEGAGLAFVSNPSDAERQEAISQGEQLAGKHQGYPVRGYVVYSVANALILTPGEGAVEAVQLATPLERARWAGYFLTVQGKPVTPEAVQKNADLPPGNLAFIVYAHSVDSGDPKDQEFLQRFGPARLELNGRTLRPVQVTRSDASLNNYRDASGQVVFRWTGTVTYRFDLSGENAQNSAGHLRFTDASGKRYDLPLKLGQYR